MQIKAIKGVKDILPDKSRLWRFVEKMAQETFSFYGFEEIIIPIIEKTDLFIKSIGAETDIVKKEMYTFEDRGGECITLRPEGTASVVRSFVEHNLHMQNPVTKLFYFGPMFRRERPQAGRYRQFYQVGAEAFGSSSPILDAEVICMLTDFISKVISDQCEVHINTLGCLECRGQYRDVLKQFFSNNLNNLCEDCNRRYQYNPLRILDCKSEQCRAITDNAPSSVDYVCESCGGHHDRVKELLLKTGVSFVEDKRLVRGLDYYTQTAFEVVGKNLGAQNAVAGGGRYDNLVKKFGGPHTPAIGFAVGVDRLVSLIPPDLINDRFTTVNKGYLVTLGEAAYNKSFELTCFLRKEGVALLQGYEQGSMKSQMRKANKLNARYVLIVGDDELASGNIIVKDMNDGTQESVNQNDLPHYIKEKNFCC